MTFISHCLSVPVLEPIPKFAMWQEEEASTIMCCPVLNPQMMGEPVFPGDVMEKESIVQSPIDPPACRENSKLQQSSFYSSFVLEAKLHLCSV